MAEPVTVAGGMESVVLNSTGATHPYYPLSLPLPHYVPNTHSTPALLGYFSLGVLAVLSVCLPLLARRPNLGFWAKSTFMWFVLCGFIHFFFEGYFVYNHEVLAGDSFIFGQLWKEYSLSDSRYLSSDTFVLLMELITAVFDGPMAFATAYSIYKGSPFRHPAQLMTSLAQLYGNVLYYSTTLFHGAPHCRPQSYYFWGYFVFLNGFWIVLPVTLGVQSCCAMYQAVARVQALDARKKTS
ncbi:hypothetical protein H4R35_005190 [Dimargaris xerosporica]|nr:hypothetical protein H4R35_005190 [Dimargaris xerosporica]